MRLNDLVVEVRIAEELIYPRDSLSWYQLGIAINGERALESTVGIRPSVQITTRPNWKQWSKQSQFKTSL